MARTKFRRLAGMMLAGGLYAAAQAEPSIPPALPPEPPAECQAHVGYDRDLTLPGYILPTSAGPRTCIPFTSVAVRPPAGYEGDFYVDEFTDEKLRQRWEDCKADKDCHDRVYKQVLKRHPPNHEYKLVADASDLKESARTEGDREHEDHDHNGAGRLKHDRDRYLLGKIRERGPETDLKTVRRPGFFARDPYRESIARADPDTSIVEFTVPAEAYERLHGMTDDVHIRGWYIRGGGVGDGRGHRKRALIIISGGGGDRIAAIDDPVDKAYAIDPKTGETIPDDDWPSAHTGAKGMQVWRSFYYSLHRAGFDVLALDRRGIGISGGYSDTNTLQQGHDLLDVVASLRSGKGMRTLSPKGVLTMGHAAAAAARGGAPDDGLPVFFLGSSRGTMASGFAMTINFDKDCSYDLPTIRCKAPREDPTIKGALLIADFSSGVGYLEGQTTPKDDGRGPGRDRGLFVGGIEEENNIVFFPSSAILAGIHRWPSAFFARGLWCYADGLEGAVDSYTRVKGLKDLVVVRGPHPYETWPEMEKQRVRDRAIAYARAVLFDQKSIPGRRTWSDMKQLVATASDVWEPSTHPTQMP